MLNERRKKKRTKTFIGDDFYVEVELEEKESIKRADKKYDNLIFQKVQRDGGVSYKYLGTSTSGEDNFILKEEMLVLRKCYFKFISLCSNSFDINVFESHSNFEEIFSIVDYFTSNMEAHWNLFIPDLYLESYINKDLIKTTTWTITSLREFYFKNLFHFLYFQYLLRYKKNTLDINYISKLDIKQYLHVISFIDNITYTEDDIMKYKVLKTNVEYKPDFSEETLLMNIEKLHLTPLYKLRCLNEMNKIIPSNLNFFKNKFDNILSYIRKHEDMFFDHSLFIINSTQGHTGIHSSKFGVRSCLINLGPNTLECYTIDRLSYVRLNRILSEDNTIPEGKNKTFRFFPNIEFFLHKGIDVSYTLLKSQEMLIISYDYVVFYTSYGDSLCFSYEFGLKEIGDMEYIQQWNSLHMVDNAMFNIRLDTLLMDIVNIDLNFERKKNIHFLNYARVKLKDRIQNDNFIVEFLKMQSNIQITIQAEPKQINPQHCDLCFNEIFNYATICKICDILNNDKLSFKCLKCCKVQVLSECKGPLLLYYKYEESSLDKFLIRLDKYIDALMNNNINRFTSDTFIFQPELSSLYKNFLNKPKQTEDMSTSKIDLKTNELSTSDLFPLFYEDVSSTKELFCQYGRIIENNI